MALFWILNLCYESKKIINKNAWRCTNSRGRKLLSLRKNSIVKNSKLSIRVIVTVLFFFAVKTPVCQVATLLEVSSKTAVDFYALFWNTCSWVLQNSENCDYRFGGPGKIIQIDESVVAKRKYNRGRMIKEKWIFGGCDPEKNRFFVFCWGQGLNFKGLNFVRGNLPKNFAWNKNLVRWFVSLHSFM